MAKMAGLHAQLSELPDNVVWTWANNELKVYCNYCGDTVEVCKDAQECPAGVANV